ncbi:MAG: LacI family DNA-binding transcriptional regulator [Anaerolineae bacterium]
MAEATVYDVARHANVSIATVSRVLNTPDKVNPATRARVIAAIDALGFVPNAEATARARKTSGRIGVLAPFFTYPSFVERLRGVATALAGASYEFVVYAVDAAAQRDANLASIVVTRRVDGLVIMALPFDDRMAHRLADARIEATLVEFSHNGFNSIEIDDVEGGRLAAAHFLATGRRRCAFVGDSDLPDYAIHPSDTRLAGYRRALAEAGCRLPDEYLGLAPHGLETARQATLALLDLPRPPDAIFAVSDTQAMGVLKAARDRGLKVPDDLAVIGFDDIEVSEYIGLTTVRQPLQESGRIAVELVLSRLADPSRPVQHVRLPLTLVVRETA